jgi:hypothetical protein
MCCLYDSTVTKDRARRLETDHVARGFYGLAGVQSEMLVKGGQGSVLERDDVLAIARRKVEETLSGAELGDKMLGTLKMKNL